jgi:hypothetical protein
MPTTTTRTDHLSWLRSPEILLGAVAPFAAYQVATHFGASELAALTWGALFPLAGIAVGLARRHRLDVISAISLVSIAVGLAGGLAFLGSLLAARPLILVIARAQSPERAAVFDARWAEPGFRRALRGMTAVWGVVLLAEAATRVVLSLLIPAAALLLVSPLLAVAFLGPVGLWTVHRRRSLKESS